MNHKSAEIGIPIQRSGKTLYRASMPLGRQNGILYLNKRVSVEDYPMNEFPLAYNFLNR